MVTILFPGGNKRSSIFATLCYYYTLTEQFCDIYSLSCENIVILFWWVSIDCIIYLSGLNKVVFEIAAEGCCSFTETGERKANVGALGLPSEPEREELAPLKPL